MLRFTENKNRSSGLSITSSPRTAFSAHGLPEATQAQAEGGTVTGRYMSPLRVAQAITALTQNLSALITNIVSSFTQSDGASWGQSKVLRIGNDLTSAGSAADGSANQNIMAIQGVVPSTSSANNYEKAGLIVQLETNDASSATTRDITAIDSRGIIGGGISTGRAWGITSWGQIISGSDGILNGIEIDIDNNGSDQGTVGTTTSKYGLQITSIGTFDTSAAIITGAGTTDFHKILWSDPNHISSGGSFLELEGTFKVDKLGNISGLGGTRIGFSGSPAATSRLEIGDANFYLDFNSGTPLFTADSGDAYRYDRSANQWIFAIGGADVISINKNATATHTALLVWDNDNATLERVTVGAADSGGAGFKVLRIPN